MKACMRFLKGHHLLCTVVHQIFSSKDDKYELCKCESLQEEAYPNCGEHPVVFDSSLYPLLHFWSLKTWRIAYAPKTALIPP